MTIGAEEYWRRVGQSPKTRVFQPDQTVPNSSSSSSIVKTPSDDIQQAANIDQLRAEFDQLLQIKDNLQRDYLLIRQAKASDIASELYKEMFMAYKERRVRIIGGLLPLLRQVGIILGRLAIFSGLFLFIMEAGNRKEAAHNESWKILNDVKVAETSSAGRIGALQNLTAGCEKPNTLGLFSEGGRLFGLRKVQLIDGFMPDCVGLQGLDAQQAHLPNIDLAGAELGSVRLQDTGLWEADFTKANLTSAQLWRAELSKADLTKANLEKAEMQGSQLPDAVLTKANLTQAKLNCASDRDKESSKTHCVDLGRAKLDEAKLIDAELIAAELIDAELKKADLFKANLSDAKLMRADLTQADLWDANFSNANLTDANLSQAILFRTDLRDTAIVAAQLSGDNPPRLCETKLPIHIEIDADRDCDLVEHELKARYFPEVLAKRYSD